MEEDQKNIEGIVLPLFGVKDSKHIEWGKWSPSHQMCMFAPVKVDGVQYVIVQDELDGFPKSTNTNWLKGWLETFQPDDFSRPPFPLRNPVKSIKPDAKLNNDYVVCLEESPSAYNFYMLFAA